ncbi:hypothetical protein BDN72DRAFT_42051 [Pluteus cervinus]|uniref:Uncharacterized protein n=1 Tax=Pluteus cervinus TaxID=181527 RepID=A0ACD3BIH0_9AGAR|nr:hypothetical protein BDN72DRAFT_42051 [Pluteus cervinus]
MTETHAPPHHPNASSKPPRSAQPAGPAPPAPATAPPAPPTHASLPSNNKSNNSNHTHPPAVNGTGKAKRRNDVPIDPATMYETLKNKIAALEEEEVLEEEEERRFTEEAQTSVRGLEENAVHAKYIELFAEFKRLERDHAKEKQKLVKDKDAAKGQLTKANQTKTKMESLARELQKDNKRLREDGKRLAQSVEDAQDELTQMKNDLSRRADRAKIQDLRFREMPDIVVKVVCRYRAELFFKISRKTKLLKLFSAWTDRMERSEVKRGEPDSVADSTGNLSGQTKTDPPSSSAMQFIFTHNGRAIESDQTPEEVGMEDGDEILAVEIVDLTEGMEEWDEKKQLDRPKLRKCWNSDPEEAARTVEEMFDMVTRERLKDVLRQYELRERHFECVIRSKELEVLLSRARAAEQKQLAEGERVRAEKLEEEKSQVKKELEDAQNGQTMLVDKLIAYCKETPKPNAERTQRLFTSLREELERKVPRGRKGNNEIAVN